MKKLLAFVLCAGFVCSLGLGVVGCDKSPAAKTTTPAKTTEPTTTPKTT